MAKKPIYFWLRLDNNFYKNLAIKKARKLAGGDTMVVIYQKMMLKSLETDGVIYYEGMYGKLEEELALMIDEEADQVSMTISFFQKAGLIQIDDDNNVEMSQVPALLGQETNWARYKREQRKQKKLDNVQPVSSARPTELEKELDTELETEKHPPKPPEGDEGKNHSSGNSSNPNLANQMLQAYNHATNRNEGDPDTFAELAGNGIQLGAFKDVLNWAITTWTNIAFLQPKTLVERFNHYSKIATEIGFVDGYIPPQKKSGKRQRQEPQFAAEQFDKQQRLEDEGAASFADLAKLGDFEI